MSITKQTAFIQKQYSGLSPDGQVQFNREFNKAKKSIRDSMESGQSGFIHAEINALIKLNTTNPCKKVLYTTLSPCVVCAKAIINARIDKVVYSEKYCDKGLDLLVQRGIVVGQLVDK